MGADEWRESAGRDVARMYASMLDLAGLEPRMRVLDIGTGRGELVRVAIEKGAARAVGVDYSPAAIELANETLRAAGDPPGAEVILADARRIPVEDGRFDLVTMLDVVEHLSPEELQRSLEEAARALTPGGRIFVHTAPTPLIYAVTYRLQRWLRPDRWRRWPADPRNDFEHRMHVNEQRPGSLRRALRRAGFAQVRVWLGQWVYADFVPDLRARRLYHRLARVPSLRRFGVADLFARGSRPAPRH
jgi:ubiquinone/menaquinone biosynthesis C-methylase UbiE